jgi:xanthine/CO dehydrogenase XdhC/CoxF family maturation factor
LVVGFPAEISRQICLGDDEYAVVMTHHYEHDKLLLEWLVNRHPRYIGVLGPRQRTERMLPGRPVPVEVRSPIGLSLGATGPDEIAVSIVAELIRVRRAAAESLADSLQPTRDRLVPADAQR